VRGKAFLVGFILMFFWGTTKLIADDSYCVEKLAEYKLNKIEFEQQNRILTLLRNNLDKQISQIQSLKSEMWKIWQDIEAKRKDIESKKREIEKLRAEQTEIKKKGSEAQSKELENTAKYFASMKPTKAASIMNNMDPKEVARILLKMNEKAASDILSRMDPKKAAEVTTYMERAR
jgi:flagellar motility protein MotE (MotC chaperone)